jgi:hypothetical protein
VGILLERMRPHGSGFMGAEIILDWKDHKANPIPS